jgi:hypothetical protein
MPITSLIPKKPNYTFNQSTNMQLVLFITLLRKVCRVWINY